MDMKDFKVDLSSLEELGKVIQDLPNTLMNQLSKEEQKQVNKLVDIDQTDLGAIEKLMKDLKNKQNAD